MEDSGSSPSGVTGGPVDTSGLSFTATYDDGTTGSVIPSSYTPTSFGDTVGTQTVTFSFEGTDITVDVDYDVEAPVLLSISISGTPATQRAFTAIDTTGLTVIANYSNDTHIDVTSDATWTNDQTNTGTWGTCLRFDTDHYVYDITSKHLVATYGGESAQSTGFVVYSQYPTNTAATEYELTNEADAWMSFDAHNVTGAQDTAEPWDGEEGGYLIEGATAGAKGYMVFSKSQYTNDTAVDISGYESVAGLLGPKMVDDANGPGFGYTITNGIWYSSLIGLDGTGTTDSEFVLVIGELANNIDPSVGIKASDFATGADTFFFKIVAPVTP